MTAVQQNFNYKVDFFKAEDHQECSINGIKFAFFDFVDPSSEIDLDMKNCHVIFLSTAKFENIKIQAISLIAFHGLSPDEPRFRSLKKKYIFDVEYCVDLARMRDNIVAQLRLGIEDNDSDKIVEAFKQSMQLIHLEDCLKKVDWDKRFNQYFDIPNP